MRVLTASAEVPASASEVFAFLSNPRRHHVLDGSGSVRGCAEASEQLGIGSVFTMSMRLKGLSYRSRNEIVDFGPPIGLRGERLRVAGLSACSSVVKLGDSRSPKTPRPAWSQSLGTRARSNDQQSRRGVDP
jgi:hypothetical protein